MNADTQSLRDDLAFLRTLVQAGEDNYRPLDRTSTSCLPAWVFSD